MGSVPYWDSRLDLSFTIDIERVGKAHALDTK